MIEDPTYFSTFLALHGQQLVFIGGAIMFVAVFSILYRIFLGLRAWLPKHRTRYQ